MRRRHITMDMLCGTALIAVCAVCVLVSVKICEGDILKAAKLIRAKGYDEQESYEIAIRCFDNAEQNNNGMPVEWYIEKIVNKEVKTA